LKRGAFKGSRAVLFGVGCSAKSSSPEGKIRSSICKKKRGERMKKQRLKTLGKQP